MFKINGIAIPAPVNFEWTDSDLSSDDTGRIMNGEMNKDIIATKVSFPITWAMLSWTDTSILLNALGQNGVYAEFMYPDPKLGTWVTKTIYTGDRQANIHTYISETEIYWDVTVPNIEK